MTPAPAATVPWASWCCRCTPMTARGCWAANGADPQMSRAPDGIVSSRGWSTASSATRRSARRAARPRAVRAARWTSCPQACMAPFRDDHAAPVCSASGSASSSARTAIDGPAAGPILMSRPVPAITGASGAPSAAATAAEVRASAPDSSGWRCSSCRNSMASGSSAASAAARDARRSSRSGTGSVIASPVTGRPADRPGGRCPIRSGPPRGPRPPPTRLRRPRNPR